MTSTNNLKNMISFCTRIISNISCMCITKINNGHNKSPTREKFNKTKSKFKSNKNKIKY